MRAALLQLLAASAGTLAVVSAPSCTSTCEEQGTCGPFSPAESGAGGTGTGGSSRGGTSGGGGTSGTGGVPAVDGGTGGEGGVGGDGGEGGEAGTTPDPCDPLAPEDGCIIDDTDGVYVSPTGTDTDAGSKAHPFGTIGRAIAQAASSGRAIYVCNGTFDEHLEIVEDGLVIRGGYACPSQSNAGWTYRAGERARVRPADTGYALRVNGVEGLLISDLELAARDAEEPGENSVAVFVTSSDDLDFVRTRIVAGDGVDGEHGVLTGSNHTPMSLDGNGALGAGGGAAKACTCTDETTSTGAAGGAGGLTPTAGAEGLPDYGSGGGERGEASTVASACTNGGLGAPAPSRADASGAESPGSIDATNGWLPHAGDDGTNGQPGQGGGGGGGGGALSGKGGGGGGACGGCGGFGGPGGMGGGASIAVLALNSVLRFDALSVFQTGTGGAGGDGAGGQMGQNGGTRGGADGNGCPGGPGGKGAAGGAGGGGAGGVSVGILFKGGMISAADVTFVIGDAGPAGQGGGAENDGVAGDRANLLPL